MTPRQEPLRISLLAAMEAGGGIGLEGGLPWRLSTDLRRFKALTLGHHLIMGRKTYDSIGRSLPGRTSIVITRQGSLPGCDGATCRLARSLDEALALAQEAGETEVFVIGGGQIFALALPLADRIYLTRVQASVPCDVFFPDLDEADWQVVESSQHPAGEKDDYAHAYQVLERKSSMP